ncbi:hypothetical protein AA313_de0205706 [Arthrobotrys entomopaga]|nr:hypothetical protein AA313_de0205706 [Arthrobotrys entomopaga]
MRTIYTTSYLSIFAHLQWVSAYQLAFFPEFLGTDTASRPTSQVIFHTYPRFRCNAIDFAGHSDEDDVEDLDRNYAHDPKRGDNFFVQNIVLRISAVATGPPKAIAIYDADPNAAHPCDLDEYMTRVIRWLPLKPSTQSYFTTFTGYMTHFKEIRQGDREWAIVAENKLRPGDVAGWDMRKESWDVSRKDVDVYPFDQDLAFDGTFANNLDSDDEDDAEALRILDELDHNTVHSDSLDENDPKDMEFLHFFGNPKWSTRQEVPPQSVYRKGYRDWRNYRLKRAKEYRRLPIWLTRKFGIDRLRKMGYVVDMDLERQLKAELVRDLARSEQAEKFYEGLHEVGYGNSVTGNQALDDLIWGWPPREEQANVDSMQMLMSIDVEDDTIPYNPNDYAIREEPAPDSWRTIVTVPPEYANRDVASGFPEGWTIAQLLSGSTSPENPYNGMEMEEEEEDHIEEEGAANDNVINHDRFEAELENAQDNQGGNLE